jgi:hypothetical protein
VTPFFVYKDVFIQNLILSFFLQCHEAKKEGKEKKKKKKKKEGVDARISGHLNSHLTG